MRHLIQLEGLAGLVRIPTGLVFSLAASAALACSTVVLGDGEGAVVAYSYDIAGTGDGFVFANPAGMQRSSIMDGEPAFWTAEYDNITFSQMGPGMPAAGMNTAGLVVTLMWNGDVVYPRGGSEDVVNELEFIQRLLDLAGSVDEALGLLDAVRIQGIIPIHFLLADSKGTVAMVAPTPDGYDVRIGDSLPIPALTNSDYLQLVEGLSDYASFGGDTALPDKDAATPQGSLERFATAAVAWRATGPTPSAEQAFSALDGVENIQTRWQIIFDPDAATISFQVPGAELPRRFELSAVDFECQNYPLAVGIASLAKGGSSATFAPVGVGAATEVLTEVLAGFPQINAIGPNIAQELTAGLFASASCKI